MNYQLAEEVMRGGGIVQIDVTYQTCRLKNIEGTDTVELIGPDARDPDNEAKNERTLLSLQQFQNLHGGRAFKEVAAMRPFTFPAKPGDPISTPDADEPEQPDAD